MSDLSLPRAEHIQLPPDLATAIGEPGWRFLSNGGPRLHRRSEPRRLVAYSRERTAAVHPREPREALKR